MDQDHDTKWHLDKKVPLALIVTIALQTVAAIWWASAVNQRVADLERNQSAAVPRLESVIRLETKVDALQSSMTEIKSALTTVVVTANKPAPSRR
jgi:hypothetical protein